MSASHTQPDLFPADDRDEQLRIERGVTLLTPADEGYPKLLRFIPDPPKRLYVRGRLDVGDAVALAIVGARSCTHYGREQADRLAALCASAGLCIVSGGAYGIDAAAHRAALRAGGRTIVVLGNGLEKPYPADHARLFDQIVAEDRGAIVTELPMATPPRPENFPRRNRVISGLALGVLVVEASLRSGALITARLAAEEHHREVMALPGRVDSVQSAGCHKIIREGWASLVTNAAEVLDALGETGQWLKAGLSAQPAPAPVEQRNLTESQRKIVQALGAVGSSRTLDELAATADLPIHCLQADLTVLQIRGLVRREHTGVTRCR